MAATFDRPARTESPTAVADRMNWSALVAFVAVPVAAGTLVGLMTDRGPWYDALDKPALNPPAAVFAPVWTVLYVLIGLAGCVAWQATSGRHRVLAIGLWAGQLVLNLAWSPLFFGLERAGLALAELIVLDVAIATTVVVFTRSSRLAAALLLPYLAWSLFATYLNAGIVALN